MEIKEIQVGALCIRKEYAEFERKLYGRSWEIDDIAVGLVGDVGDLMKLIQAKKGIRKIENHENKLAHELSDCLWSIFVLADLLDIDLEDSFKKNMDELEKSIIEKLEAK